MYVPSSFVYTAAAGHGVNMDWTLGLFFSRKPSTIYLLEMNHEFLWRLEILDNITILYSSLKVSIEISFWKKLRGEGI